LPPVELASGKETSTVSIREYEREQTEAAKPEETPCGGNRGMDGGARRNPVAIKEASRKGKDAKSLRESLAEMAHYKPEPPRVPKLLRVDDTPESLAWVLAQAWPSAVVASSDAGIVFGSHGMGRERGN
jgi:putative DNA primase/helicase